MAELLWPHWPKLESRMKKRGVMLFLDYDGKLTPIVRHPSLARLSPPRRKFLEMLTQVDDIKTAIISGRSLAELKQLIRVKGILYVCNHGLEFEDPQLHFIHPKAQTAQALLKQVAQKLTQALEDFPEVWVEDKTLTLSIHYRKLNESKAIFVRKIFSNILQPYLRISKLALTEGKKVWEVRPPTPWNKGRMVLWLLARFQAHLPKKVFPIYAGDDRTDEDAFRALKGKGITLKVAEHRSESTEASYYVRSPSEVFLFLMKLKALKEKEREVLLHGSS